MIDTTQLHDALSWMQGSGWLHDIGQCIGAGFAEAVRHPYMGKRGRRHGPGQPDICGVVIYVGANTDDGEQYPAVVLCTDSGEHHTIPLDCFRLEEDAREVEP